MNQVDPVKSSKARQDYEKSLRQLNTLMKLIEETKLEMEAILDTMDNPWYQMSEEDRATSRHLSEQLYNEWPNFEAPQMGDPTGNVYE